MADDALTPKEIEQVKKAVSTVGGGVTNAPKFDQYIKDCSAELRASGVTEGKNTENAGKDFILYGYIKACPTGKDR